jgi:hypothetical protein
MEEQNAFAGQGAVLLDIGGDVGALVVHMPAELAGVEIEIRPLGHHHGPDAQPPPAAGHSQLHTGDGGATAVHGHDHGDGAHHHHGALPHVAVVARPTDNGLLPTAVFPELATGTYELYERLEGTVRLTVAVVGGEVAESSWPGADTR